MNMISSERQQHQTSLLAALKVLRLDLPSAEVDKLLYLLTQLMQWNTAYNLTAIRDPAEALRLHILDSLSIFSYITGPGVLDVGTGPGFPALPLAIALPDIRFTALDSNGKKIRFIRQMVHELGLKNVEPVQSRVEMHKGQYQQITSRAFADLQLFIQLTEPLLAPQGQWLAMKSQTAQTELSALGSDYAGEVLTLQVPDLQAERSLVKVWRC